MPENHDLPEAEASRDPVQRRCAAAVRQGRLQGIERRMIRLPERNALEGGREGHCRGDKTREFDALRRQGDSHRTLLGRDLRGELCLDGLFAAVEKLIGDTQLPLANRGANANVSDIHHRPGQERHRLVEALAIVGPHAPGHPVFAITAITRPSRYAEVRIVPHDDRELIARGRNGHQGGDVHLERQACPGMAARVLAVDRYVGRIADGIES